MLNDANIGVVFPYNDCADFYNVRVLIGGTNGRTIRIS